MQNDKPLYLWSLEEAIRNNEKDLWRESYPGLARQLKFAESPIDEGTNAAPGK